jgi:hypothetical protein
MPEVALACGSQSTSKTRLPNSAKQALKLIAVVVLPTPPFWLTIATTTPISLGENEPKHPMPRVIVVLDLTDESHGNAAGLGLADITTKRLISKVDWHATHVNVFTSGFIERDRIPVVAESDRQALEWALEVAKVRDPEKARIVRIRDTNTLGVLYISQGCGTKRLPTSACGSSTKGNWRFRTVS